MEFNICVFDIALADFRFVHCSLRKMKYLPWETMVGFAIKLLETALPDPPELVIVLFSWFFHKPIQWRHAGEGSKTSGLR